MNNNGNEPLLIDLTQQKKASMSFSNKILNRGNSIEPIKKMKLKYVLIGLLWRGTLLPVDWQILELKSLKSGDHAGNGDRIFVLHRKIN
ncbi:hypothetical protein BpHYR1_003152 [Brachionus plicatilis]|uniref:Uncharacterized protein n=1 Tax=Brachionus plicatilis TaxID=10195 RepID=A0A3M7QAU1_BRAPC|nr:hypothetical protein BpHYR1_003152 [Brachionus plicatilis]